PLLSRGNGDPLCERFDMKKATLMHRCRKAVSLIIFFWLTSIISSTAAGTKQLTLPSTVNGIIGSRFQIGLTHLGTVGLVVGGFVGSPTHLVSFITNEATVADDLILDDFPPPVPGRATVFGITVNDRSGLAMIFGNGANQTQTVAAAIADEKGKLTRKWAVSYPNPKDGLIEITINADGSAVYVFYNDS